MAIRDEFSGNIHVEFIVSKTQTSTFRGLDNFLRLMRSRVPQYKVRCIRTDNGTESHNKLWDNYLQEEWYPVMKLLHTHHSPMGLRRARTTNSSFVLSVFSYPLTLLTTPYYMTTQSYTQLICSTGRRTSAKVRHPLNCYSIGCPP